MHGPKTRPSLIAHLANPDAEIAWNEFHQLYQPLIYRTARARGLQHADAEDLVQDVLGIVGNAIHRFDPKRSGSFRGWLYTVTRNACVNAIARGRGERGSGDTGILKLLDQQAAEDEPTATVFHLEYRRERFQNAARKLKEQFAEDTWKAFWMTSVEQQSIAEVARQLGKSEGAVRMARCRVVAQFRNEVEQNP